MKLSELALWQAELVLEHAEQSIIHFHGFLNERNNGVCHPRVHGRRVCAVNHARPGQYIILRDVQELRGVFRSMRVGRDGTTGFVAASRRQNPVRTTEGGELPKRSTVVSLLEEHLLLDG